MSIDHFSHKKNEQVERGHLNWLRHTDDNYHNEIGGWQNAGEAIRPRVQN